MVRATHRPSSGAKKLYLQPLVLHTFWLPNAAMAEQSQRSATKKRM